MKTFGLGVLLVSALFLGVFVQAQAVEADGVANKIQLAKNPTDHEAIAQIYENDAKAELGKAKDHKRMADSYSKTNAHRIPMATSHCEALAKRLHGDCFGTDGPGQAAS